MLLLSALICNPVVLGSTLMLHGLVDVLDVLTCA